MFRYCVRGGSGLVGASAPAQGLGEECQSPSLRPVRRVKGRCDLAVIHTLLLMSERGTLGGHNSDAAFLSTNRRTRNGRRNNCITSGRQTVQQHFAARLSVPWPPRCWRPLHATHLAIHINFYYIICNICIC